MCDKVMGASMIYPKLINVKKTNIIMKILVENFNGHLL